MIGHGSKYPRKRDQAILSLLTHRSIGEAAKAIGISEATLYRWLQTEEFQQGYQEGRREAVRQAISQLQQLSGKAVGTLGEVMLDQETPPSTRVSAARIVLEMTMKAVEIEDLTSRVEKLERLVEREH
ncbi:MAG: helix-turn-helix domain-containing protein [candidate division Zixibacteria bacterium]|nr:helix-turn-helix domain-containing protein [candidate division Zixibacteria bacterium]